MHNEMESTINIMQHIQEKINQTSKELENIDKTEQSYRKIISGKGHL